MKKKEKETTKMVPIKNGRGEIRGYVKMYWSESLQRYVTIPE